MAEGGGSAVEEGLRWWNWPGKDVGMTTVEWRVQWGARGRRGRPEQREFRRGAPAAMAAVVEQEGSSSSMGWSGSSLGGRRGDCGAGKGSGRPIYRRPGCSDEYSRRVELAGVWRFRATWLDPCWCRGAADLTAFKAMRWLGEEEAKERGDRSGSREEQRLRRRSPWRKERKSGGGSYGRGCTWLPRSRGTCPDELKPPESSCPTGSVRQSTAIASHPRGHRVDMTIPCPARCHSVSEMCVNPQIADL